jgi:hypothetical protein
LGVSIRADAIQRAFEQFDIDGNGVITLHELQKGLQQLLRTEFLSESSVESVMKHLDTSGDGVLQPNEFVGTEELRKRINAVVKEELYQLSIQQEQQQPSQKDTSTNLVGIFQRFLQAIGDFEDIQINHCESNYDCQRPEVCCDFHFTKQCCSSGIMARELTLQYATVPVPQQY